MSTTNSSPPWGSFLFIPFILCWSLALTAQQGEILSDAMLPELPATALEVIDGTVYCGTSYGGFYTIESASEFQFHNSPVNGVLRHSIIDIAAYEDQVAICFEYGAGPKLYLYDPSKEEYSEILNMDSILPNTQGTDVLHAFTHAMDANDSTIFIGTSAGLITYKDGKNTQYTCLIHVPQLPNCWDTIYDVKTIGKRAWLALEGEIAYFHPDTLLGIPNFINKTLPSGQSLNEPRVTTLAPASEKIVYLTTSSNLLMKYDHGNFDTVEMGSADIEYRFVRESKWQDGKLWMINGDGLYVYDGNNTSKVVSLESGRSLDVTECIKAAGGQSEIWYASCLVDNERPTTEHASIVFSPNPAEQTTRIEINNSNRGPLQFLLTDLNGRTLYTRKLEAGRNSWSIPLHSFQSGYYFGIIINQHDDKIHGEPIIITQ